MKPFFRFHSTEKEKLVHAKCVYDLEKFWRFKKTGQLQEEEFFTLHVETKWQSTGHVLILSLLSDCCMTSPRRCERGCTWRISSNNTALQTSSINLDKPQQVSRARQSIVLYGLLAAEAPTLPAACRGLGCCGNRNRNLPESHPKAVKSSVQWRPTATLHNMYLHVPVHNVIPGPALGVHFHPLGWLIDW